MTVQEIRRATDAIRRAHENTNRGYGPNYYGTVEELELPNALDAIADLFAEQHKRIEQLEKAIAQHKEA